VQIASLPRADRRRAFATHKGVAGSPALAQDELAKVLG
jgi:hypothetical protein